MLKDVYKRQGDECGVSKYVVQSVATVPHQVKRINDFIVKAVEKYPYKLIGFGSLHPDMKDKEEEIDKMCIRDRTSALRSLPL